MEYQAIVSAHIYKSEDGSNGIEIFNQIDNDKNGTGIFDDIDHALLEQVEPEFEKTADYFFMALVASEFIRTQTWEGIEYDVEHEVRVIKSFDDLPKAIEPTEPLNPEGVEAVSGLTKEEQRC